MRSKICISYLAFARYFGRCFIKSDSEAAAIPTSWFRSITSLALCLLSEIQKFFEIPEGQKNWKNGKHSGTRKQRKKEAYEKSGGIPHDTAAFVFRTKDILKIRIHPQLEPDSDFHLESVNTFEVRKIQALIQNLSNSWSETIQPK